MSVKTKKIKRYSKNFKQDLVNQVANGLFSRKEACSVYGVSYISLLRWSREFGISTVEYIDLPLRVMANEETTTVKEEPQADSSTPLSEDLSELQRQVVRMQQELQHMSLRAEAAELTIEIAERDLGLDIRKKSAAKSSPK